MSWQPTEMETGKGKLKFITLINTMYLGFIQDTSCTNFPTVWWSAAFGRFDKHWTGRNGHKLLIIPTKLLSKSLKTICQWLLFFLGHTWSWARRRMANKLDWRSLSVPLWSSGRTSGTTAWGGSNDARGSASKHCKPTTDVWQESQHLQ